MLGKPDTRTDEQRTLAIEFQKAMETSGVPPKAIAELCGITEQAVSNWRRTGKIARKHLPKIAMATKWSVQRLLTGKDDATEPGIQPPPTPEELEMLLLFRDMPTEDQAQLYTDIRNRATKARDYVERFMRERFGVNGHALDARVNSVIPPPPGSGTKER